MMLFAAVPLILSWNRCGVDRKPLSAWTQARPENKKERLRKKKRPAL